MKFIYIRVHERARNQFRSIFCPQINDCGFQITHWSIYAIVLASGVTKMIFIYLYLRFDLCLPYDRSTSSVCMYTHSYMWRCMCARFFLLLMFFTVRYISCALWVIFWKYSLHCLSGPHRAPATLFGFEAFDRAIVGGNHTYFSCPVIHIRCGTNGKLLPLNCISLTSFTRLIRLSLWSHSCDLLYICTRQSLCARFARIASNQNKQRVWQDCE